MSLETVRSLETLAARQVPDPMLKHLYAEGRLDEMLMQASITATNVRVEGRCSNKPTAFSVTLLESGNDTEPILRIDTLDEPSFWFELDRTNLSQSRGRTCCFDSSADSTLVDGLREMAEQFSQEPHTTVLPRTGSCWLVIRQTLARSYEQYRVDCMAHLAAWLLISIHE